jgi:hypothetical protein
MQTHGTVCETRLMPSPEYETSPSEVRTFAFLQLGLTTVFLALLVLAFGGAHPADFPPWWVVVALLAVVAVAAVLAERVWLSASPMDPTDDPEQMRAQAVGIFAGQIVRKLAFCEAAVIIAVVVGFVAPYGGWPMIIGGVPGLALLAFETWPSLRNTSMTAAMLDAEGADSGLVEAFRSW